MESSFASMFGSSFCTVADADAGAGAGFGVGLGFGGARDSS
jgi:hypothetical protein